MKNIAWKPGPANGNDKCDFKEGDTLLVLVHCVDNRLTKKDYWDIHVIVATEDGWDDAYGESWGAWDWSDVSWYMELTKENMPQLLKRIDMKIFGCVGNTIRLRSGLYLDLADPQPDQFTLADIAGALSKICRFGGQIGQFYSVAEHCYHCSRLAEVVPSVCLMHDAAEAFTGDIVKPLKVMLRDFTEIERKIETVIARKYNLDFEQPEVSEIDQAMLIAERRVLFSRDNVKWHDEDKVRIVNPPIRGWLPMMAESMFLSRAAELGITD